MRASLAVVIVAGCAFEHGSLAAPGPGIDAGADGAPPLAIDAAADAAIDAPTPCGDSDGDGVCNGADDWPCGAKPLPPASPMVMTANAGATQMSLSSVDLDGEGRLAVATANTNVTLGFAYQITDTACTSNCIDQIEIGWTPGSRVGCPFDQSVSRTTGASGNIATTIRTPAAPGVYDLRANIGQNYSCTYQGANSWWGGAPAATRTIAKLCVH